MTPEGFGAACRALPAATMDVRWGDDHDAEAADWLRPAHALTAAKLTRKVRAELGFA